MPTAVAAIMAFAALSASIFSGVDPMTCLVRGGIAYAVGYFCAQLWYAFFGVREPSPEKPLGLSEMGETDEVQEEVREAA